MSKVETEAVQFKSRATAEKHVKAREALGWRETGRDSGDLYLTVFMQRAGETLRVWWRR